MKPSNGSARRAYLPPSQGHSARLLRRVGELDKVETLRRYILSKSLREHKTHLDLALHVLLYACSLPVATEVQEGGRGGGGGCWPWKIPSDQQCNTG